MRDAGPVMVSRNATLEPSTSGVKICASLGLGGVGAGVAVHELGFGPTIVVERAEPGPGNEAIFSRFTGFSLEVADIAAAHAALTARGVVFEGPPVKQYWGGTMAFFSDPAGNNHTLLQRPGKG